MTTAHILFQASDAQHVLGVRVSTTAVDVALL